MTGNGYERGAFGLQRRQVLGVVEAKRCVLENANSNGALRSVLTYSVACRLVHLQLGRLSGHVPQRHQINMTCHDIAQCIETLHPTLLLSGQHQPQVPCRQVVDGEPRDGAEHWHFGRESKNFTDETLLPRCSDAIQNDAGQRQVGVERQTPEHQRCNRARRFGCVNHENDGRVNVFSELSRAVSSVRVDTVEEAAIALDDCDICIALILQGSHYLGG